MITNQEITIQKKDWASAKQDGIMVPYGKPHSNYKLTYHIQKENDNRSNCSSKDFFHRW